MPLQAQRRSILAALVVLAVAGWAVVGWQATTMDHDAGSMGDMAGMAGMEGMGDMAGTAVGHQGVDLTAGMSAPLFFAMWLAMMVAMMFPASAPMVVAFARSQARKRERGAPPVPTWLFVAPYIGVWLAFGAVGYGLALGLEAVVDDSARAADDLSRVTAALLIVAGLYQLTPLKRVCLAKCRTPMSFMLSYWRDGRAGAVRLGLRHALFCVGCCWVLFLVLVPIGVMNVAAMVVVAALVFAEKVTPRGEMVARAAAVALVAYGVLALAVPGALPTTAA